MASAQGISTPAPPVNRGTMIALPTNLTSLSALLIILGDGLIFLLIALAFRLLSPMPSILESLYLRFALLSFWRFEKQVVVAL